ncbi:MAG: 30S ribosomal protein S20 [Candidatus Fermentibacteraceae bacterium]|nr:30S ribosomal protein S20 [Candidatus Fermentibacteraceae bacterium]
MARSRQSLKRRRTDIVKAKRNRSSMRTLRTAIKNAQQAEDPEERTNIVKRAQSLIDRAARNRLIHPNKADRLKASLMKQP